MTAMAPITDAVEEGLRTSASEVKQGLEALSQHMRSLFLAYAEKYKEPARGKLSYSCLRRSPS